jgi:hypothetical protein
VINPSKGYVVSANNFITSSNAEHGISHAFAFQHRAIMQADMIEYFKKNGKLNVD